jgi:hypothetical protein
MDIVEHYVMLYTRLDKVVTVCAQHILAETRPDLQGCDELFGMGISSRIGLCGSSRMTPRREQWDTAYTELHTAPIAAFGMATKWGRILYHAASGWSTEQCIWSPMVFEMEYGMPD